MHEGKSVFSHYVTLILAGIITVTGPDTTVFLWLAGTQEMMAKIIIITRRENLILRFYISIGKRVSTWEKFNTIYK